MVRITVKGDAGHKLGFLSYNKQRAGKGMWVLTAHWDTTPVFLLPITLCHLVEAGVLLRSLSAEGDLQRL